MGTGEAGLREAEASRRLEQYGPNAVVQKQRYRKLKLLGRACVNPLVILLLVLAVVSLLTGDLRAATVMLSMVVRAWA